MIPKLTRYSNVGYFPRLIGILFHTGSCYHLGINEQAGISGPFFEYFVPQCVTNY